MNAESHEQRHPDPDPLEPTGKKPSTRTRFWVLAFAIVGVIIIMAITTWLATGNFPGQSQLEQQQPAESTTE